MEESGTGKNTHTRIWRENISTSTLLNDDSPIVFAEDECVSVWISPWSGKTPCHKQEHYPLAAFVRLSEALYNKIEKLSLLKTFGAINPSFPSAFAYDSELYDGIRLTLDRLSSNVPVYHPALLPERDVAMLSYEKLPKDYAEKIPKKIFSLLLRKSLRPMVKYISISMVLQCILYSKTVKTK